MEMLMARAEAERSGLERELRAMRCTASEAAQHLHAAEEGLRVSPVPVPPATCCLRLCFSLSKACLVRPEWPSCLLRIAHPRCCMQSQLAQGRCFVLSIKWEVQDCKKWFCRSCVERDGLGPS